jgi:hypothetical protein
MHTHRVVFEQVMVAASTLWIFVLLAPACGGKDESSGTVQMNQMKQMSAASASPHALLCPSGAAHPNVCCGSGPDAQSRCSVFPSDPFHPCDPGWTMYPDPTRCCDLADSSHCDEPPAPPLPPPAGRCVYGCKPGFSPNGPTPATSGSCCKSDGTHFCYGWGGPGTGSNATENGGVLSCDFSCPAGWTKLAPAVCCSTVGDAGALCFSQATGPVEGQSSSPPGASADGGMPTSSPGVGCFDFAWNGTCECSGTLGGTKYSIQCSNTTEVIPGKKGWCTCTTQPGGTTTAALTTAVGVAVCPTDGAGYSLAALSDYWTNVCAFPH